MKKVPKNSCKSASHRLFKDKAKNRVDDLQLMFLDLQFARKESRTVDAAVLEEQVHQMLREWKAELNEPSPASSLQQGGSLGSFSTDICRLLQLCEEEDDASSQLAAPKPEPNDQTLQVGGKVMFQEWNVLWAHISDVPSLLSRWIDLMQQTNNQGLGIHGYSSDRATGGWIWSVTSDCNKFPGLTVNQGQQQHDFPFVDECKHFTSSVQNVAANNPDGHDLEYHQFDLHQDYDHGFYTGFNGTGYCEEDAIPHISSYLPSICPPPSAFLGPKCALWDCPRPAQGLDWCQDYCSSFHAALALNEGPPGMAPVLRPGGIGLKDNLLFAALSAKAQGKDVGIPECEGAATAKSPWNAPELFDLSVLEGETIREWLFFDKPRRAFESGNRKQRSLPDYSGRGWHESRKQVMNEFGGLKRSYYMDPQPLNHFEWHLYEYEISKCDACALYRLELKLVDGKKNSKTKAANDSVADLQKQMGRLSAEFPHDNKRAAKGRAKINTKVGIGGGVYSASHRVTPLNGTYEYGLAAPYDYLVDNMGDYYGT
ncbi:Transcription factor VOZ1 isoform B [Glycine soja]|uniref:Transcription factor VOZ1 isoform B n=1 Tax=Glycine soja TaxID=3848 RepID=A0A445I6G1_GLYSO|nr:Transcription factor VOZ1 isoform B [Glycine soja]